MEILLIIISGIIGLYIGNKFQFSKIKGISVSELKSRLETKDIESVFVDVRTLEEYRRNKIKGFVNIPLNQMNKRLKELPKDKEIVVLCQSGSRSMTAAKTLFKAGYTKVINVKGGMSAWMDQK